MTSFYLKSCCLLVSIYGLLACLPACIHACMLACVSACLILGVKQCIDYLKWFISTVPSMAPTSLHVTLITFDSVTISWTNILPPLLHGRMVGYSFHTAYCGQPVTDELTYNTSTNIDSVSLSYLSPAMCYNITVAVINSKGTGPRSHWINVTTTETGRKNNTIV